ncbi:hypothetical protein BK816_06155 [Boudabousia tangfeifanii]|uniref:Growth inhibitor PemK n=1 Tax=Boudabousia tangfeifanii TaxID=1912795 RepID=A0A1D9MMA8_9ACTO|nr:hypothetical protein BK816_06155 [Boudabousia tangfeifanii]
MWDSLVQILTRALGRAGRDIVDDVMRDTLGTSSPRRGRSSSRRPSSSNRGRTTTRRSTSTTKSSRKRTTSVPSEAELMQSAEGVNVWNTEKFGLPPLTYDPHPDGVADPGEVVWTWIPYEEDPTQGKDRPVLVLSRHQSTLIVSQLTSKNHHLDEEQEASWGRYWFDVGSGDWDAQRRPSQMRVDRLLAVQDYKVRREGGRISKAVFDQVCDHLRDFYGE